MALISKAFKPERLIVMMLSRSSPGQHFYFYLCLQTKFNQKRLSGYIWRRVNSRQKTWTQLIQTSEVSNWQQHDTRTGLQTCCMSSIQWFDSASMIHCFTEARVLARIQSSDVGKSGGRWGVSLHNDVIVNGDTTIVFFVRAVITCTWSYKRLENVLHRSSNFNIQKVRRGGTRERHSPDTFPRLPCKNAEFCELLSQE